MPPADRFPTGIIGFPVTPWNPSLGLDEPALRSSAGHMVEAGLDALSFCGSNGELHALTVEEYERICEIASETVEGRVYLIFGVGQSWRHALAVPVRMRFSASRRTWVTQTSPAWPSITVQSPARPGLT